MKSGDWIILGILGSISLVGAFFDVRSKTVPRWLLTVGGSAVTIAVALCLFQGSGIPPKAGTVSRLTR